MMLPLRLIYALLSLGCVYVGRASPECIEGCSDWSIVLGHCRGQFIPNPYQTNVTYATGFLKCLCDGSKDGEVMGTEQMRTSAQTCSTCVTAPDIIVVDLVNFVELCTVLAENGTASEVTSFSPIGYSVVEYDGNGKAIKAAPKGTLV